MIETFLECQENKILEFLLGWMCSPRPLNPALGRWRQADLCDLEASQINIVSSRTVGVKQSDLISKIETKTNKQKFKICKH